MTEPVHLTPEILSQLRPSILSILRSSDLQQVSAKKVRLQLNDDGLLTRLGVELNHKPHKSALDEEIRAAFGQVDAEVKARQDKAAVPNHKESSSSSSSSTPFDRKPVGIALPGGGVRGDSSASDAAMAAALQKQFNADAAPTRSTRGAASASSAPRRGKTSSAGGKKRKLKGEDTISSDEEDGSILEGGTPKKKKPASKKKKKTPDGEEKPKNPNNPFNKPQVLSPLMAEICGGDEMPRYVVTKKLWEYIKGNQLQDPDNGRTIVCDEKLKTLFGKERVDSFQMAKLMSPHLKKKEDVTNP